MSETSSISRLQELLPQLFESTHLPGDACVRCELTPGVSALISMALVQESLLVSAEQITPIPNMAPYVLGLMNSRSRVFCAIDLAQLLGLPSSCAQARQYHTVAIRVSQFIDGSDSERELLLGLVVDRLQGMTRVMPDEMSSPQAVMATALTPYIQRWAIDRGEQLPVLDLAAIVKLTI